MKQKETRGSKHSGRRGRSPSEAEGHGCRQCYLSLFRIIKIVLFLKYGLGNIFVTAWISTTEIDKIKIKRQNVFVEKTELRQSVWHLEIMAPNSMVNCLIIRLEIHAVSAPVEQLIVEVGARFRHYHQVLWFCKRLLALLGSDFEVFVINDTGNGGRFFTATEMELVDKIQRFVNSFAFVRLHILWDGPVGFYSANEEMVAIFTSFFSFFPRKHFKVWVMWNVNLKLNRT